MDSKIVLDAASFDIPKRDQLVFNLTFEACGCLILSTLERIL